ncbi:MAG: ribosome maturation factor RimM [Aggregatilineales bacterium]
MPQQPDFLILGKILRPHGIRGELRMSLITDFPEHLRDVETIYLGKSSEDKKKVAYELEGVRFHKSYALLTLADVFDRNDADALRGKMVMVDIASAVQLEDGEYYLFQLINLTVQTADGQSLGRIKDVMETGANDVYIVQSEQYGELLLPAHDETIVEVNVKAGYVTMQLPEGLLPAE